MSNRLKITAAVLLVLAVGAGLAAYHMFGPPPSGLDLSRTRMTEKGIYSVSIAPEVEPFKREVLHSWIVTVLNKNQSPAEGATITVDGGMPRHGHGLPTSPQVTADLGGGRYRVEGVKFHMFGWWEFKFAITAAAGQDSVTFNLDL